LPPALHRLAAGKRSTNRETRSPSL
jgi:hypothetical protein